MADFRHAASIGTTLTSACVRSKCGLVGLVGGWSVAAEFIQHSTPGSFLSPYTPSAFGKLSGKIYLVRSMFILSEEQISQAVEIFVCLHATAHLGYAIRPSGQYSIMDEVV
ncbi:hypothetical protein E1B28_000229 [Marasmius oreades]|uniref:Uncharacterized protein n=1 Tax=Marasmius oreades TaxID=181124 RepID=A0A9P7V102_9AGAR|nr:uncharacterized protein E1B28_000229 [Marasmius oreades]KAG7098267.1 hypothetical protein E1B28_000229 [Marasmius oreades]